VTSEKAKRSELTDQARDEPDDGDAGWGEQSDRMELNHQVSLRRAGTADVQELELRAPALPKFWLLAAAGLAGLLATLAAVVSVVDRADIAWVTGVVLVGVVALTVGLCVHAGGHVWLVPVPAAALAAMWAVTVGSGNASSALTWWLAGGTAAASGLAVLVALPALAHPMVGIRTGADALRAAEGTAVTPLSPTGVVQVAGEPWTAESLSGPLPVGAPVHVVRVDGLRLQVWSEAGTVPGPGALEAEGGLE
jgi:membrane-bound ClpP family serine protease